jgi:hypothetical protein
MHDQIHQFNKTMQNSSSIEDVSSSSQQEDAKMHQTLKMPAHQVDK